MKKGIQLNITIGGRSGDRGRTFISVFFFAKLFDGEAVYHESNWDKIRSRFFRRKVLIENMGKEEDYDRIVEIEPKATFEGLKYTEVMEIYDTIKEHESNSSGERILYRLVGCPRVHIYQMLNWVRDGHYQWNVYGYVMKITNRLFWTGREKKLREQIAIHVRRGDTAPHQIEAGFSSDYYLELIRLLNQWMRDTGRKLPIKVFTEHQTLTSLKTESGWQYGDYSANDLKILESEPNVSVFYHGTDEIESDMEQLASSEYFFQSNSGFSRFSSMVSLGDSFYDGCLDMGQVAFTKLPGKLHKYGLYTIVRVLNEVADKKNESV